MGTAGGEPRVLLNALKPMLGVVGDIKTPQEVMRVVGMMKDAEKLMSRCIYLNILKATCKLATTNEIKKETLQKFLAMGGWGILNKWLVEFMKTENFPVLLELIDVLKVLPITVDLLKQGNTGKIMKSMTKLENADVKKNASELIKQWKSMIRGPSHEHHGKHHHHNHHHHHSKHHGKGNEAESADQDDKKSYDRKEDKKSEDKKSEDKKSDHKKSEDNKSDSNGKHDATDDRVKRKLSTDPNKALDSSGFLAACFMPGPAPMKKKRRHNSTEMPVGTSSCSAAPRTSTHLPLDEILNNTPPLEKKDTKDEEEMEETEDKAEEDLQCHTSLIYYSPAVEAANAAMAQDTDTGVLIDEGSLARKRHKPKRNITWASGDKLVQVSYFEVQPGENKDRHAENFSEARQLDLQQEKQAWKAARFGDDRMVEKVEWRILIPVDGAGVPGFTSGEKSKQKFVQDEREKTVLAYIYLTGQSLPDSPGEPDFDPKEVKRTPQQPVIIPHDDNGGVMPPAKVPVAATKPEPHRQQQSNPSVVQSSGPQISLSPNVQEIMSQLLRTNSSSNNSNGISNNSNAPTATKSTTPQMMQQQPPLPSSSGPPGSVQQYPRFPNNNPIIPPPNMGNNFPPPHHDGGAQALMDIRGGPHGRGTRYQGIKRDYNNGEGVFPGPVPGHHRGGRWNGGPRHHGPPPPDFERGGFRGGRGGHGGPPPNTFGSPHRGGDHRGYKHGSGDFNRGRGRGRGGHSDRPGGGPPHRGRGGYHEDGQGGHNRNNNRDSKHRSRDDRSNRGGRK